MKSEIFNLPNKTEEKKHDFKLSEESKKIVKKDVAILADSVYQGMKKLHKKLRISLKKSEIKN